MTQGGKPVLVAGAGITGLSAALAIARKGGRALVVDPRPRIGGLAGSHILGGLPCRAGIHLLHPSSDELAPVVRELAALMGSDALTVRPVAAIHFLGRFLRYPFQTRELVVALGPRRLAESAASALAARARSALGGNGFDRDTFQDVVQDAFGRYFYGLFFRDYTAKVLGVEPSGISGDWARRRVPMPGRRYLAQWLFPWWRPGRVEHSHDPFSVAQVTGTRGMDSLFDGILANCGDAVSVRTETALAGIEVRDGAVRGAILRTADGAIERLETDHVVATIPLPDLVGCLEPWAPANIVQASRSLRYRGIVFVFLVLSRPRLLDTHWTYFQDAGMSFNRVSEFGNVVPGIYGKDRTVVCAEVTADPGEHPWDGPDSDVVNGVIEGLARVTGSSLGESLIRAHVVRERHAYPNWLAGYRDPRDMILDRLDAIRGLTVVGRQARFDYLNMDECADAAFGSLGSLDKVRDGA